MKTTTRLLFLAGTTVAAGNIPKPDFSVRFRDAFFPQNCSSPFYLFRSRTFLLSALPFVEPTKDTISGSNNCLLPKTISNLIFGISLLCYNISFPMFINRSIDSILDWFELRPRYDGWKSWCCSASRNMGQRRAVGSWMV